MVDGALEAGRDLALVAVRCVVTAAERARSLAARWWPFAAPAPGGALGPAGVGPRERVGEAKFDLGRVGGAVAVGREPGELPRAYGRDRLVALPRDPWWLFLCWEIVPATRIGALRDLGARAEGVREVLRLDVLPETPDAAPAAIDVEVPAGVDHWYLHVGRPGTLLAVELGLRATDGTSVALVRSQPVRTPAANVSPDTTVRWVTVQRHGPPVPTERRWNGHVVPAVAADDTGLPASPVAADR